MKFLRSESHRNISYLLAISFSVLPFVVDFDTSKCNPTRAYAAESSEDLKTPVKTQTSEQNTLKADKNPIQVKEAGDSSSTAKTENKDEVVSESTNESEVEIISITDALKQGQLQHEKNLVDKFLLGIAVIFLVIAFFLFNSLPPSSPEQGSG